MHLYFFKVTGKDEKIGVGAVVVERNRIYRPERALNNPNILRLGKKTEPEKVA